MTPRDLGGKAKRTVITQSKKVVRPVAQPTRSLKNRYSSSEKLNFYRNHPRQAVYYNRWQASLGNPLASFKLELPWITYSAVGWLKHHVNRRSKVFEWGSGGSTLFLASRVRSIISVEHDPEWFAMVGKTIKAKALGNVDYRLAKAEKKFAPKTKAPQAYGSSSPDYKGYSFYDYCRQIAPEPEKSFDLVIVDGRSRGSCVFEAISKIRPGSWLLLDNSDRKEYASAIKLLNGWKRKDFYGPTPGHPNFAQTSVFQRPRN